MEEVRSLRQKALEETEARVIPIFEKIHKMKPLREEAIKELDVLLPSILDKAFKGEL